MPLGAARTAQYANFWNTGTSMPVNLTVDFAATGGFSHYYWPMTVTPGNNNQVVMYNNANWDFTTTSAPTTWGSFFACMIYIPTGYFASCAGNDAIDFWNSTQFFDAYGSGSWTSCSGSLEFIKNDTSDTYWQLRPAIGGQNPNYDLTAAQTTAIEGKWVALLHSVYDSTTNYTSWTGGTGTGSFNAYHRVVAVDVVTATVIWKVDFIMEYDSGNAEPAQSSWKGRSDFVTNGPAGGVAGIDIKFFSRYDKVDSNFKAVNWWFAMGSTMDPYTVYDDYCIEGTWTTTESPYAYLPLRDSSDWVNKTTFYRPKVTTTSRFQGTSGAESPCETSTATPTPTLVYL